MTEEEWRDEAEREGAEPHHVVFDGVTHGLMRGAGVDPVDWVGGLAREEATPFGVPVLIGLSPGERRQEAARDSAFDDPRAFDVLDVIDDDGVWRASPVRHIPIGPAIHWLPVTRTAAMPRRPAAVDVGVLTMRADSMPDVAIAALPGRPLSAVVARPGFEHGTILAVVVDGGTVEIRVTAPDAVIGMRRKP